MNLILCLDDKGGMQFNNRRQSSDKAVVSSIQQLRAGRRLWMNSYSAKLFAAEEDISVSPDFLSLAKQDDFCFVEDGTVEHALKAARMLIIYRWNRVYPADVKFPGTFPPTGWCMTHSTDFAGHSHERITQEVYIREDQ